MGQVSRPCSHSIPTGQVADIRNLQWGAWLARMLHTQAMCPHLEQAIGVGQSRINRIEV
jgi:hypothetical protein